MLDRTNSSITPDVWEAIVKLRIQAMCLEWNTLSAHDRFWLVCNWLDEYHVSESTIGKRQLLLIKSYWQESCST